MLAATLSPYDLVFDSELQCAGESLMGIHKLTDNIVVTLPHSDAASTARKHTHSIDMQGHKIAVVIPGRIFNSVDI